MDIQRVIKQHNLTQQEVANRMGINRIGLNVHINGNPSVAVLERIANAIGCNVSEFFTDSETSASIICPHCGKPLKVHIY